MIAFPANLDLGKTQGKLGTPRLDSGRNGSPCGKLCDSSMEATTCGVEGLSVGKKLQAIYLLFILWPQIELPAGGLTSGIFWVELDVKPSERGTQAKLLIWG